MLIARNVTRDIVRAVSGVINIAENIINADQTWTAGTVVSNGSAVVLTNMTATASFWIECPTIANLTSHTFSCTVAGYSGTFIAITLNAVVADDLIQSDGFFTTTFNSGAGTNGFSLSGFGSPSATLTNIVLAAN